MNRFGVRRGIKFAVAAIVAIAVFIPAVGYVVMSLWNWLLPPLAGWHAITLGQAIALLILCRLLFGGLRHRHGWHWRHRLRERWERMTPEERERFRANAGWHCRHVHGAADDAKSA